MDPILIKALREYLVTKARLAKTGVNVSPEHEEEFFRVKTNGKYGLQDAQKVISSIDTGVGARNVGRSVVQGGLMDWGDELLGALPEAIGGGEGAKEEMRLRGELFHKEHPYVDAGAGMVGAIGTGLLIPGGEAATLGKAAAKGAAIGAVAGGMSGLGKGEGNIVDRAPGAVIPALIGAAAGGTTPLLIGGAKIKFSPTQRATRRVEHAIEESGGAAAVRAQSHNMATADRGDIAMLGDMSERLRLETDFAANNSDDVLSKVASEVQGRQRESSSRLLDDTRRVLGGNPRAVPKLRELKAERQSWAKTAYDGLRADNQVVPLAPETAVMLQQPVVKAALAEAKRTGQIGAMPDVNKGSFSQLKDVKEALDDAVEEAFRKGHGNRGTRLAEVRDKIDGELAAKVKGYTEIQGQYRARKAAEAALDEGRKTWNVQDTEDLTHAVQMMEQAGTLEHFRYGLASKLISALRSAKTNRDMAKRLMDSSIADQDKLRVVFGSKEAFDEYMRRVGTEADLGKMKGVFGNSATQRRAQAAGFDPIEMGVKAAEGGVPSPAGILSRAYAASRAPMDRATARKVGEMVTTKGTQNIDDFLLTLTNGSPLLGRMAGRALPAAVAGLLTPNR